MGHDAVVLNVGGTLFTSTWTTLLNHTEGGSFFSGLHAVQPPDEDDAAKAQPLLVDRDPEVFKFVLAYLRTGHVELRPPVTATVLLREAQYFSVRGLERQLVAQLEEREQSEGVHALAGLRTDGFYSTADSDGKNEAAVRFTATENSRNEGTLIWSKGKDAAHALRVTAAVALASHAVLPSIWRKDADTADGLAHFLVSNIRRGTWQLEHAAVSILRESFPGEPTDCPPGGKTCRYYGAGLRDEVFLAKVLRAGSSSYTPFERFTFVADSQFEDSLRAAHGRVVSLDDSHRSPSFTVLHGAPVRPPPW